MKAKVDKKQDNISNILHVHLRQALEKNQQWLVYDREREDHIQAVVSRVKQLEQELAQAREQQVGSSRAGLNEASPPPPRLTTAGFLGPLQVLSEAKCEELQKEVEKMKQMLKQAQKRNSKLESMLKNINYVAFMY